MFEGDFASISISIKYNTAVPISNCGVIKHTLLSAPYQGIKIFDQLNKLQPKKEIILSFLHYHR